MLPMKAPQVIRKVKNLDTPTKVRQLFGFSASLREDCLEKFPQNAPVRVDKKKRVIEYSSHDGSFHLQGQHDGYSKIFVKGNADRTSEGGFVQLTTHGENPEVDFEKDELNDDSAHEFDCNHQDDVSINASDYHGFQSTSTPRTVSKKTSPVSNINTTRKTRNERKIDDNSTDTHKGAKKSNNAEPNVPPFIEEFRTDDLEDYNPNTSPVHSNSEMNGKDVKDEEHHLDQNQDVCQDNVNNDDEEIQVGPRTVDASNATEIEEPGTSIPNAQIVWTMKLCFSKMTESSVRISSERPQFINLRDFLCYLKSFSWNLKNEKLKSVMDKTNEYKNKCQNKRVRVKQIEEILRATLDNITIQLLLLLVDLTQFMPLRFDKKQFCY